jgi:hypothetical protein
LDVTRYPDHYNIHGQDLTPDLGILGAKDPVAIDQASLDLINENIPPGQPGLETIYGIDPAYPINYAEEFGLGRRDYNLDLIGD